MEHKGKKLLMKREEKKKAKDVIFYVGAGGMAASLRVPFTAAQWQELERQTIIYKYMMASVPIPPELLIPISRSLSDVTASHSNRNLLLLNFIFLVLNFNLLPIFPHMISLF